MGEPALRVIAHELIMVLRATSRSTGCTGRARGEYPAACEAAAAKYGYPPDLQDAAVQNVLQQAEALASAWAD